MTIERAAIRFATTCGSVWLLTASAAVAQSGSVAADAIAIAVRPAIVRIVGACEGSYRLPDTGQMLNGRVSLGVVGTGAIVSGDGYVLTSDRLLLPSASELSTPELSISELSTSELSTSDEKPEDPEDSTARDRALVLKAESSCEPLLRASVAEELTRAFTLVNGADSGKLAADVDYVRSQLQIQSFAATQTILLADGRELEFQRIPFPTRAVGNPTMALVKTVALVKIDAHKTAAIPFADPLPDEGVTIARVGYPRADADTPAPPNPALFPTATVTQAPTWAETIAIDLPDSERFVGSPIVDERGQLVALQVGTEGESQAPIVTVPAIATQLQAANIALQPTLEIELPVEPAGSVPDVVATASPTWPPIPLVVGAIGLGLVGGGLGAFLLGQKRRSPSALSTDLSAPSPYKPTLPPNLLPSLDGTDGSATRYMPRPMSYGSIGFITGELAGQQFVIPPQGLSVGRDGTMAQVVVDRPGISRQHVWIGIKNHRVVLEDVDSVNGTFLNDPHSSRIQGEVPLHPGDTVILADDAVRFRYFAEAVTPDETVLAIGPKSDYGLLTCIQCIDTHLVGQQFPIPAEGLTIGRDASQAHIAIDSRELSKQHVWVGPLGEAIYAIDNGSLNGTYLNQLGTQSIKEEKLTPGDTIVVSNSNVAQFRYSPPSVEADLHSEEETWFPNL